MRDNIITQSLHVRRGATLTTLRQGILCLTSETRERGTGVVERKSAVRNDFHEIPGWIFSPFDPFMQSTRGLGTNAMAST